MVKTVKFITVLLRIEIDVNKGLYVSYVTNLDETLV